MLSFSVTSTNCTTVAKRSIFSSSFSTFQTRPMFPYASCTCAASYTPANQTSIASIATSNTTSTVHKVLRRVTGRTFTGCCYRQRPL